MPKEALDAWEKLQDIIKKGEWNINNKELIHSLLGKLTSKQLKDFFLREEVSNSSSDYDIIGTYNFQNLRSQDAADVIKEATGDSLIYSLRMGGIHNKRFFGRLNKKNIDELEKWLKSNDCSSPAKAHKKEYLEILAERDQEIKISKQLQTIATDLQEAGPKPSKEQKMIYNDLVSHWKWSTYSKSEELKELHENLKKLTREQLLNLLLQNIGNPTDAGVALGKFDYLNLTPKDAARVLILAGKGSLFAKTPCPADDGGIDLLIKRVASSGGEGEEMLINEALSKAQNVRDSWFAQKAQKIIEKVHATQEKFKQKK